MAKPNPGVVSQLAPHGHLRVAINYGNPVLAYPAPSSGAPAGISVDLATELARHLGVDLEFITFDAAGKVFSALKEHGWDCAFLAIDPVRAEEISFTAPYVVIEGTYLVKAQSPFWSIQDLDCPGVRIAVGKGAAYDLFLTRTLEKATLCRADTSSGAVELFLAEELEAAAGVRQPLQEVASSNPNLRVIDGRFTEIRQAMGIPRGREEGACYVAAFVEEMKASGFVAAALERHNQRDAAVAPAASPSEKC